MLLPMANTAPISNWYLLLLCSLSCLILASAIWVSIRSLSNGRPKNDKEPDSLRAPYWIPGLGNAYQYIFHNMDFLQYVIAVRNGREVLQFRLGPKRVYLVSGAKQVDKVLRHGGTLSADEQTATMLQRMASVTKSDIEKFRSDSSGRGKIPLTNVPEDKRIWHAHHRLTMDHLSSPQAVQVMTDKFCELFSETLLSVRIGKWETVRVYDFLQKHMFSAAVAAMAGTKFLESEPHFVENFWKYDRGVYPLILGTPRLLRPGIYAAREAFHEHGKYFEQARASFDWNGPDAEANWEPIFGSRFSREQAKFLEAWGFESKSKAGMTVGALWAQNANTIPITAWAMIEIIKDQDLLKAIKEEVATAAAFDNITKLHKLNIKKLSELPLLQSVYTETLRMHVSVNVTREVTGDMHMGGFVLKKGSLVQTPTWIAHFDETVWSHIDHPATEFWAARHIKYDENVPQFSVAKKSVGFFPFGGGVSICPGRHFAKVEVMAAIALLVMNFDMEFVEYTCLDGTESGRSPKDDERYCGSAAMPPDRDMKIRWKRC